LPRWSPRSRPCERKTIRAYVRNIQRTRKFVADALQKLGIITFPSAGNFILANFGPSGPAFFAKLEQQGILLRDRTHDMGPGFVRITIGTPAEMKILLREIRRTWKQGA
jgi:histidinol-phosphate/aromatic aminotransferase/cobyric acid decarboxylase-like protein